MTSIERRAARLVGWRRWRAACLLGAVAALAMPPLHLMPFLFVAMGGLVLLIDGCRGSRASLAVGWWFGFGYFVVGLYWIANALLTDPWRFGWMIPVAVGGLAALQATLVAAACLVARLVWPMGPGRVLVLAVAWTVGEWVRGWAFSGFPWNLIGYSWAFSDGMNQLAALFGIWGLSFLTVAVAGSAALPFNWHGDPAHPIRRRRSATVALATAGAAVLLVWLFGAVRLGGADEAAVAGLRVRIVQANIEQRAKNDPEQRAVNLRRHIDLTTRTKGFETIGVVLWPESALPYLLERQPVVVEALASAAPPGGLLLTGAPTAELAAGEIERLWNSLAAIDDTGAVIATYDKFHLVPYGEYVPLRSVMPFIAKVTPGDIDFSPGPGPRTLRLPGLPPVGPLICYEVIFPGAVADGADRPAWLLNLTNDGWYGMSTGPYQHFAMARLRAVEEGIPLVRAANTGISGVVDAYGRVTARLGLGDAGVIDAELPAALAAPTPFARYGLLLPGLLLFAALALAATLRRTA